jgi:hypothetical protein
MKVIAMGFSLLEEYDLAKKERKYYDDTVGEERRNTKRHKSNMAYYKKWLAKNPIYKLSNKQIRRSNRTR